jgi:tRNA1Val (adenine37-N6)-methyltransferase
MKVGVDAVLLGSLAKPKNGDSVLDIGCGSGILMLMIAQKFDASKITGIDININAIEQTKENIENSSFRNEFVIQHTDLNSFKGQRFDYFICNPPFFKGTVKSIGIDRYEARSAEMMPLTNLFSASYALGTTDAKLGMIYPFEFLKEIMITALQNNWIPNRIIKIKGNSKTDYKRVFIEFGKESCTLIEEEITIENARNDYTKEYIELTKEFYLNF